MKTAHKTALFTIAFASLALAGCSKQDDAAPDAPAEAAKGGPPPLPPYEMRAAQPAGNRLAVSRDGKAVFEHACGYCHLNGGMGTNLLIKQRIAVGEGPEMALLTNRKDLTADYVKQVVRQGKAAMPPQTRVDITDAELDSVAQYLAGDK
ncbi:MAG: cytochrome c [Sphingomonadaceae bacterium]|nr:cytochrome c [Sphingomonadaceae bacterium]